jgi:hypothetical protein
LKGARCWGVRGNAAAMMGFSVSGGETQQYANGNVPLPLTAPHTAHGQPSQRNQGFCGEKRASNSEKCHEKIKIQNVQGESQYLIPSIWLRQIELFENET